MARAVPVTGTGISGSGKLRLVAMMAVIGVGGGTIGFMLLEGMDPLSALYMTVITLSTVGFGEVAPLHPYGRLFVIVLIAFGMAMAGTVVTFIGDQLLGGHVKNMVARRKMEAKLKKMSNHFIVAGYGRVGQEVVRQFVGKQFPFVVVEKDEALIARVVDEGAVALKGDATDDEVLIAAGIDRAQTLISTLPEEAQNVYLTLTARYMNANLNIIARADFEEGEKKLLRAGANHVVIPHVLGGHRMAKAAMQPNVVDFMHMASMGGEGLMMEELIVPEASPLTGKTLAESRLKQEFGISVIGIKQGSQKMDINPASSTTLAPGNVLIVVGEAGDLERFGKHIVT